jgi:hypothetical protein
VALRTQNLTSRSQLICELNRTSTKHAYSLQALPFQPHCPLSSYNCPDIAGCWWLTPVILATQELEIRRTAVQSQLRQIVHETLSRKTLHKKGLVEWLKVWALSSSPSIGKKKKNPKPTTVQVW